MKTTVEHQWLQADYTCLHLHQSVVTSSLPIILIYPCSMYDSAISGIITPNKHRGLLVNPENITVIIDTREQRPLLLKLPDGTELITISRALTTGDYSIVGMENEIAIERKSLDDLAACCGRDRERFEKQLIRLKAYPSRAVVVEGSWAQIERHSYRSRVSPNTITGTILKWINAGVPFVLADDPRRSGELVARLLFGAARARHRSLEEMFKK